jgi:signal transduction histidine kinase
VDNVGNVVETVTSLIIGLVIVRVATHWLRSPPAGRRVMTPVLIAAIAYVVVLAIEWLDIVIGPNAASELVKGPRGYLILGFVGYALPIGVLIGILRTRLARSSVADVVRELDPGVEPGRLETVLRRVLGDPALRLAYRLPEGGWVSPTGEPVSLPVPSQAVAVTMLGHGEPIAALIHDPSVGSDPELLSSVAAAARLALENERLQAEIRAQLAEVRASRARIVEAGLDARRKVERDLHDGAQQRLLALVVRLQMMRARASADPTLTGMLASAGDELEAAIAELRELARGLHPTVLIDEGLAPAVENLADRAMIPVEVTVSPERCSESCEAAAYFVVSEALANIARHAHARQARISIRQIGGDLVVEVADDGVGGASIEGSGLRGLADRVAAVGGVLTVDSPPGGGTRLSALMPCA